MYLFGSKEKISSFSSDYLDKMNIAYPYLRNDSYSFLPKKMQYDFFINSLRKKKRFSPWLRQDKIKDLDYVKRYYGYSNEKAKQALRILTKEQLTFIKSKFETGGTK